MPTTVSNPGPGRRDAALADRLQALDLNLLRVWLAVFDAGGVSLAAQVLGSSQPTVSSALARLRTHLQDPLFVRQGNRFLPTAESQRLAPVVRAALAQLGDALAGAPGFTPERSTRRFRIAMTDAGATVLLPPVAARLAAAGPGLGVQAVPFAKGGGWGDAADRSGALADLLATGELDAALGPPATAGRVATGLDARVLFMERYVALVKRGGVLELACGAARTLPTAALRSARLIVVDQPATHHGVVPEALRLRGLQPQVAAVVPLFGAAPGLVDAFDGLAIMPSGVAAVYARRRAATWVELPFKLPPFAICWITHASQGRDAGLQWLTQQVALALAHQRGMRPSSAAHGSRSGRV
jgi:DNA-binding transcriptional LysR family regulator